MAVTKKRGEGTTQVYRHTHTHCFCFGQTKQVAQQKTHTNKHSRMRCFLRHLKRALKVTRSRTRERERPPPGTPQLAPATRIQVPAPHTCVTRGVARMAEVGEFLSVIYEISSVISNHYFCEQKENPQFTQEDYPLAGREHMTMHLTPPPLAPPKRNLKQT